MPSVPETYYFTPTPHVPNSPLPVLIYRSALSAPPNGQPLCAASTRECLEKNGWEQGGVFKTYRAHHFHSVTHEAYAVFKGSSRLLLGRGPLDECLPGGQEVQLGVGDVIVLPVGCLDVQAMYSSADFLRLASLIAHWTRKEATNTSDSIQRYCTRCGP